MLLIVTPYIVELMRERKPFELDYDRCEIQVMIRSEQNPRYIYGECDADSYHLYIPGGDAVKVPYDVVSRGYGAVRDYIKERVVIAA